VVIISLLLQYIGEEAAAVFKWIFIIIVMIISPILYLIVPFMIMEKLNFIEAFKRSVRIGKKYYGKVFVVNTFIMIIFYVVKYLFTHIFNTVQVNYSLSFNFITRITGGCLLLSDSPAYYLILMVYLSVISSLYVLTSALRISLNASLMGKEATSEIAYDKVRDSV